MLWEEYKYREVHCVTAKGIQTKWERIASSGISKWMKKYPDAQAYYYTIQKFQHPLSTQGEAHIAPLFFDLDADEGKGLTLEDALNDTKSLCEYFTQGFHVAPIVWFSGNRGFHIIVPSVVFGAEPQRYLTYHYRHLAETIVKRLKVQTWDNRVYSIARMWRVANTKHSKSGLYKVELGISELTSVPAIQNLAIEPRPRLEHDEYEKDSDLAKLLQNSTKEYEERQVVQKLDEESYDFTDKIPACIQLLLDNGLALLGTKNRADMAMAGYCKSRGLSFEDATSFITAWSKGIPDSLTHIHNEQARIAQSISVLRVSYSDTQYHFSCGSIKAAGVQVDCEQCGVKERKALRVELFKYSEAANIGQRIIVEADVVGRDSKDYIVPKSLIGECEFNKEDKNCPTCVMSNFFNAATKTCYKVIAVDAKNPKTVELVDVSADNLRHRVKRLFGVPSRCYAFGYKVEWGNSQVVYLATRVRTDFQIQEQNTRLRAILLQHNILLNRGYELSGYVYSHPRTQAATFIVDRIMPLESSLVTFKLAKEELDALQIFQARDGMSPLEKVMDIHEAFSASFVRIFGRENILLAIDLVFHSARRIPFQERTIKGWLDILIIGDTGQGKSETAERVMSYYNLGTIASGETCSRTGLLYTIHTEAGQEAWVAFGLLCRANGMLVVIDEIHGMPPADFREFTLVRSKGVVDVKRAAYGMAAAETRLISIANPRRGMFMENYGFPCEAIPDVPVFTSQEDIRRFDFAVGVRFGDVSEDEINRDVRGIGIDHPYDPTLCRNLILWGWTRGPEHIHMVDGTEGTILESAKQLGRDYVPDIPLVEAADIRNKITRMATAFAIRTYSTSDGVTVNVRPSHVEAAVATIHGFYKATSLDYWGLSQDKARRFVSPEELEVIAHDFRTTVDAYEKIASWVLRTSQFNMSMLQQGTGVERKIAGKLMTFMLENRLTEHIGTKVKKTVQGRNFFYGLTHDEEKGGVDNF